MSDKAMLDDLEELYKQVHRRPELSMEEERARHARRLARGGDGPALGSTRCPLRRAASDPFGVITSAANSPGHTVGGRHRGRAAGRHQGERDPGRGDHIGCAEAAGDHTARPVPARPQRPRRDGAVRGAYREAQEAGRLSELPTNHNPRFAPVVHPTLETGLETLAAAALAWLGAPVRA